MKKMLTLAVVATMASLVNAAAVESSNIVGYNTVSLTPGEKVMTGAMFVKVGNDTLDLQDIKMSDDVSATGGTSIWWWDATSRTYATAYWVDLYSASGEDLGVKGWGDSENWIAIEKTFAPGEGFWIKAATGTAPTVTVSGQLATSDTTSPTVTLAVPTATQVQLTNPMPVGSFSLQDIKMSDDVSATGGTSIWWWDATSRTYTTAYWVDLYDASGADLGVKGWGDSENWVAIEKTFAAGEGFWVKAATGTNPQVLFKNPLYIAE